MRKLITEFIGTAFLVLTIGLVVLSETELGPIAIGSALMVMVYMGGHISGAHYNPAVSLAALLTGKLPGKDFLPYLASQILGGVFGSLLVYWITGGTFAPTPGDGVSYQAAILNELLFTFALALVVLNCATAKKTAGNSFYGLAIGFTVCAAAIAGGGISGGAFNPAVGVGPTFVNALKGGGSWINIFIYLAGPFLGGAIAAVVFRFQEGE